MSGSSGQADVEYSTRAIDQLDDLDPQHRDRIIKKMDDVPWNPEHYLQGRQMTGEPYYSLRIGDYRVIIDWRRDENVLFIRRVEHRRNVYD